MAISKDVLNQYSDLQKEITETKEKIDKLEHQITKLEKRIQEIESGEIVKDKVKGGYGGVQSFNIEGIPTKEYQKKKMELYTKKTLLESRKEVLKSLELEILRQLSDVEDFIKRLPDSHIRRIVTLRVVNNLSWSDVALKIGGGNTEDSVRMMFNRCVKQQCSICSVKLCYV